MRRFRLPVHLTGTLALMGALCLFGACGSGTAISPHKPEIPLTIAIAPQGEVERGAIADFVVTATALAESTHFSLDVELPDDLALFSGDTHQHGAVPAGTQFRLVFAVRVPETGSHIITARARLKDVGGAFEASATYPIDGSAKTVPPIPDGGVAAQRNGETVREYRLP